MPDLILSTPPLEFAKHPPAISATGRTRNSILTADNLSQTDVTGGQHAAVVLLPAPVEFTSEKALSVSGPSYAGIDADYQPVAE